MTWSLAGDGPASPGRTVRALVDVAPSHPANAVKAIYSMGGGPDREMRGHAVGLDRTTGTQTFAIDLPQPMAGIPLMWRPVLMRSGRMLDPLRGGIAPEPVSVPPRPAGRPVAGSHTASPGPGRFAFDPRFLFTVTVPILPDALPSGETPEGSHFYFAVGHGGTVRGPALEADIVSRDGDRMRMRSDGIGVVEVETTLVTKQGEVVLMFYSGLIDIGRNGTAVLMAGGTLHDAPVRFAPRYLTSSPTLGWMNRVQAFGIGEASLKRSVVEYDVYAFGPADLPV